MDFNLSLRRLIPPQNINISVGRVIGQLTITWDIIANPDINIISRNKIESVGYNIYRGLSPNGIFYKLNSNILTTNRFEDTTVNKNLNASYWYKISTVSIYSDGNTVESELSQPHVYTVKTENKWFKKMNERNMWVLKNTGILMDLYIRKTDGERCPHCWDEIRGQSANPDCKVCFGTTYVDGYEPTCQIYVRQKPANQQLDLSPQGYVVNSNPGAWTITNIALHNRDLLINPEGRMFSITNSHVNHASGYLFHQELQMKELDPLDVKYQIQRRTLYPIF